jgi:large subunit ribosomal protein L5e
VGNLQTTVEGTLHGGEDLGTESGTLETEANKERILGGHVSAYMESMQEEDSTKYEAHFSKFIENDIDADKMEEMYTEAHKKIREDPDFTPAENKNITHEHKGNNVTSSDGTNQVRSVKLSLKQRRVKVAAKVAAAQAKMAAEADD